jgi:phenylacetate-coenzyme A ligase PaaK-like adenylate-forming protein
MAEPRAYEARVFPLHGHPLYGSVERFIDSDYLLPATLAEFTNAERFGETVMNLEMCPACFFNTSGTTSRSKRIPYSDADLARQRIHESIALRKLGMGPGDGVISLGSPLPSISGWAIVNGSEAAGASVLNTSQLDYEDVFLRKQQDKATIVIGTPLVVREIGAAIAEDYGPLPQLFPRLKTAIIFGDVVPNALKRQLRAIWGFDRIYSLYGTVEADVVATESRNHPGRMDLMFERLVFEIIPESELAKERAMPGYRPRPSDIRQAPDGTVGELVITDLARDVLPLIRYRIGDVIQVHRPPQAGAGEDLTISILGRSKNAIRVDQIPLYEMQINEALEEALGERLRDWQLVQSPTQLSRFDLFIQTADGQRLQPDDHGRVLAAIASKRPELARCDVGAFVHTHWHSQAQSTSLAGHATDAKARRIVLATHVP